LIQRSDSLQFPVEFAENALSQFVFVTAAVRNQYRIKRLSLSFVDVQCQMQHNCTSAPCSILGSPLKMMECPGTIFCKSLAEFEQNFEKREDSVRPRFRGFLTFGPETDTAVRQFQQRQAVDTNGIVGAATRSALGL